MSDVNERHVSAWLVAIGFFLSSFGLSASPALAHLAAGEDKAVGTHLVDFGYDPVEPKAGEKVVLALNLADSASKEPIAPDHVWVRITLADEIIFAGTFSPKKENVTFIQTFPRAGQYTVTAQFFDETHLVAAADLPIAIATSTVATAETPRPAPELTWEFYILPVVLVIICDLLIALAFKHYARNKDLSVTDGSAKPGH